MQNQIARTPRLFVSSPRPLVSSLLPCRHPSRPPECRAAARKAAAGLRRDLRRTVGLGLGFAPRSGGALVRETAGPWAAVAGQYLVAHGSRGGQENSAAAGSSELSTTPWRCFFGRRWALRRTLAAGATEDGGGGCGGGRRRPKRQRPTLGREKADPTEVVP
ncbi:hypothetical protein OsJ_02608 [Oryza sativa Japonica Group]|uniref:Uncharacterized protein n=1 Tax=Oryza sativa subsp. japonica TaxID=39947 RepID=B9EY24_ORYSJ|nr:hypothetical protein OsJ_02608 [Oryza sativa Japonica Group]